ncbi:uncharacterized protein LOC109858817 [Pseudomyrmex gracilis]|uniref:uncharacterized protein LOC109858817 n=1 Tax=Pseudomyrmex gracilis TaxID=219809 RepID=UPI000995523A|nr:uncharacterized protein LOC109858817 [Pseudomyrmex gracilis]
MLGHFVLFFTLVCVTKCEHSPSDSLGDLYTILDQTTEYFHNLSNMYKVLNVDTSNNINNAISKYMENTTRAIQQRSERRRRSVQNNLSHSEDVLVFQNFKETLSLNLTEFQDVDFFSTKDEDQLFWFALNSSNILLFQLINNEPYLLGTYSQSAGKRIMVNNYGPGTLVIAQRDNDAIVILHCDKNESGNYELQFKQEFEIPGVTHTNTWLFMNQVYLAIATKTNIFVYAWLGEHFDVIDTITFGARKVLLFQNKSFMHIVALGFLTKIFRFSVRSNKFIETQRLRYAEDVDSFYLKESHFEERFLILTGNESTILYKETHDRFVPFQKVAPTRYVRSSTMANTVVLFFADENTMKIYQYNGWRFLFLRSHTEPFEIGQIHRIRSHGEYVLIRNQNGEWKFLKPIWETKKTWRTTQNEIDTWCSETLKKISSKTFGNVSNSPNNLLMQNAYIDRLRVRNINGQDADELVRLTRRCKITIDKLNQIESRFAREINVDKNSESMIIHGKKLTVKCKTNCYVNRLITKSQIKYENIKNVKQSVRKRFDTTKVNTINNWKCPVPNINVDDVFVKESVNGISMQKLEKETLRMSGDQNVSGKHIFTNLYATNVSIPLNIVTKNNKKQIVQIQEARVKELRLTDDNFFLPVNGSAIVMNHTITAPRVRVTRTIDLQAGIKGEGRKKLEPVKDIVTFLTLSGDRFLQNVTFTNIAEVGDVVRTRSDGRSLKDIVENIIPLDSDVPTHLTLSGNKTSWNNVTLSSYNKTWVTKNSSEIVVISGKKSARNIVLTDTTYANLPLPRLTIPLCAAIVITPEVTTYSMTIDKLKVKHLNVSHIYEAYDLNATVFELASTWNDVDFSTKLFTGHVVVKNISTAKIRGMDEIDFSSVRIYEWLDENRLKGPLSIEKLSVNNLETAYLNLSLPTRVGNVVVKADSNIKKINNIDIQLFMESVAKVDDAISLEYATFANNFTSNYVSALRSTLDFSYFDAPLHLRSKRISTTLETNAINVPATYSFASDVPSTFIVQGSVRFLKEPTVKNIKNINLKQLSENLWMADRDTVVSGSNVYFTNMSLRNAVTITDRHHPANSLFVKMWLDLSDRLLSKTRKQHIATVLSFKNVQVPSIIAANNSRIRSSDLELNDLLANSLMRNKLWAAQSVNISWRFKELEINSLDGIRWNGRFNDLDLNTDVVRRDAKYNVVTGEKTISGLIVEDLWSSNIEFSQLVHNSLSHKCYNKLVVIKGRKTFINITLNNLSVKGAIMGRKVEDMLLKSGNQRIFGIQRIQGQFNVPTLVTNSTVNDVDLFKLTNIQVKKHKKVQTIEGELDFRNDLEILGNVIIDQLYEGINLKDNSRDKFDVVLDRTTKIIKITENVSAALQNRAIYVNKFEATDENAFEDIFNASNTENVTDSNNIDRAIYVNKFEATDENAFEDIFNASNAENVTDSNNNCLESNNNSSHCNNTKLLNILVGINAGVFMKKFVLLDGTMFVTVISSDFVSISSYNDTEDRLDQKIRLHVPNILEASVESVGNSLWIILRLAEQTLILRYQTWDELEQYTLPGSDVFVTSVTPNNQHLLIRSDGMWSFKGAFRPEHIFKVPLNGQIQVFAHQADYYVKATTENSTVVLKVRYVGN